MRIADDPSSYFPYYRINAIIKVNNPLEITIGNILLDNSVHISPNNSKSNWSNAERLYKIAAQKLKMLINRDVKNLLLFITDNIPPTIPS